MRSTRILQEAGDDVHSAAAVYDCDVLGRGLRFLHAYGDALEHLERFPMTGQRVPAEYAGIHDVRAFPVSRFPYTLYAVVRSDELIVVAVAHQKRRPGFWTDRLAKVDAAE